MRFRRRKSEFIEQQAAEAAAMREADASRNGLYKDVSRQFVAAQTAQTAQPSVLFTGGATVVYQPLPTDSAKE